MAESEFERFARWASDVDARYAASTPDPGRLSAWRHQGDNVLATYAVLVAAADAGTLTVVDASTAREFADAGLFGPSGRSLRNRLARYAVPVA